MTSKSIFDFEDYKPYLQHRLTAESSQRGSRTRLAEAVKCHSAYVSQVLNGDAHFSLEQAELIGRFFELNKDEANYLFILVQKDRAGTASLKAHFENQRKNLINKQLQLSHRLNVRKKLSVEDQSTFYSAWYYGAIHVLVSIPEYRSEKSMAKHLGLPLSKVSDVLNFLMSVGLVTKENGEYRIGATHIHLEHSSSMISKHHTNWRMRAIQSLEEVHINDLHYSSVITCTAEDAVKIKMALVKAIEEVRAIVRPSKEEECFAYSIDLFNLKKSE